MSPRQFIPLEIFDAATSKPDADETVLLFNNSWDEPCWPGYWNGEAWCDPDNLPFVDHRDPEPTHWARIPHLEDARRVSLIEAAADLLEEEAECLLRSSAVDGQWDGSDPEAEKAFRDFSTTGRDIRALLPPAQPQTEVPA